MIPNKYRHALTAEEDIVITGHPAGCLMVFKLDPFLKVEKQVMSLPDSGNDALYYKQVIVGYADQMKLDAYGRALINAQLREHANLGREVLMLGMLGHVRLWDETTWNGFCRRLKEKSAEELPAGWDGFSFT